VTKQPVARLSAAQSDDPVVKASGAKLRAGGLEQLDNALIFEYSIQKAPG